MDPKKRFRPSHDRDDIDRDGPSSGVNQVNPYNIDRDGGGEPNPRPPGDDPGEVRPQVANPNRDRQQDGHRDLGIDLGDPKEVRRRGHKLRDRDNNR